MEDNKYEIKYEDKKTIAINAINDDDSYGCTNCSYPIEILKIDDLENTITFKCLNPKENAIKNTMAINKYLASMRKNTYLESKCSLCPIKQNELKQTPIFSYCIKCDKIICSECLQGHLELNEKNHPNLDKEYIIKNNEKSIKCLSHPKENNSAFCFECNTHICNKCDKDKTHMGHRMYNKEGFLVSAETLKILNCIIDIYKKRITQLTKEKEEKKKRIAERKKL